METRVRPIIRPRALLLASTPTRYYARPVSSSATGMTAGGGQGMAGGGSERERTNRGVCRLVVRPPAASSLAYPSPTFDPPRFSSMVHSPRIFTVTLRVPVTTSLLFLFTEFPDKLSITFRTSAPLSAGTTSPSVDRLLLPSRLSFYRIGASSDHDDHDDEDDHGTRLSLSRREKSYIFA